MKARGYIADAGLEDRLRAYLDPEERARLIAETEAKFPGEVESLTDALCYNIPDDLVIDAGGVYGITARPWPAWCHRFQQRSSPAARTDNRLVDAGDGLRENINADGFNALIAKRRH